MAITFFEILGKVIDSDIKFAGSQYHLTTPEVYERIVQEAEKNQREWYSNRVPNLNYQDQFCRLAYLYIVAAANANTFKSVIEMATELRDYILGIAQQNREIRVCAFGAGPGTELLALAKYFDTYQLGFAVTVDFQLLDRVMEWANSWYGIRDEVKSFFRRQYGKDMAKWPIIPAGNLIGCDVTDRSSLANLGGVWNYDIFVVNFLLSEIFSDNPDLRAFLTQVTNFAPSGAKFIFIERRGSIWQSRMKSIADDAGLDLTPFEEWKSDSLDRDERPELLGDIFCAIGQRKTPRLGWNVVYSIGTKR